MGWHHGGVRNSPPPRLLNRTCSGQNRHIHHHSQPLIVLNHKAQDFLTSLTDLGAIVWSCRLTVPYSSHNTHFSVFNFTAANCFAQVLSPVSSVLNRSVRSTESPSSSRAAGPPRDSRASGMRSENSSFAFPLRWFWFWSLPASSYQRQKMTKCYTPTWKDFRLVRNNMDVERHLVPSNHKKKKMAENFITRNKVNPRQRQPFSSFYQSCEIMHNIKTRNSAD